MTQEKISQGLFILDKIRHEEHMIKNIKEIMSEIELASKYAIIRGFFENLNIPYHVFHDYFLNETKRREEILESLEKELEQL